MTMTEKRTLGDWLKVLVLLLDEAVVLVLIFFLLDFMDVRIPLPIMIFAGTLVAVLVFIIHIKVMPSFRWKQVTGREGMMGLQGKVVQPLTPVGMIYVKGENWKAKSVNDDVEADDNVKVVGIEGLTLRVVRNQED